VLINNAGVGAFGLLENQEWARSSGCWRPTWKRPIHLTHALLPWLKAQPQAAIVNIGSTFGSLPFPGFAAYSAAKAGLRGFSQACAANWRIRWSPSSTSPRARSIRRSTAMRSRH
jgi:short-subunit dehydrogenase